jgi:hypothetical protein
MFETLGALLSKLASSLGGRAVDWGIARYKRPSIHVPKAPSNIFQHIVPGTSLARVAEILGTPHRVDGEWHSFAFSDALVQLGSKDGRVVEWIGIVLPAIERRNRFPIGIGSIVLGKSTVADALALAPDSKLQKDNSTKHWCFWTECYLGFPGLYRHYIFGVIEAPCAVAPKFKWDNANNCLESDPKSVPLNWIAISASEGAAASFNFWAFV